MSRSMHSSINVNSAKYQGASVEGTPQIAISEEIDLTATGTTNAVMIPVGSFVTKVSLYLSAAITAAGTADVDVGDGGVTDRYIDGLGVRATNDIITGPYPYSVPSATATEASTATNEDAGHYYGATDTIDVLVNATSTTGSGKVIVEYFTDSSLA